jgi:ABC-type uncharacterized transport system ATPase subunit
VEVLRTLVYFGTLRGMSRKAAQAAALSWLERLELADPACEPLKRVADALVVVNRGQVVLQGTVAEIRSAASDSTTAGTPASLHDVYVAAITGHADGLGMLMYGKEPTWAEVRRWALTRSP